MSDQWVGECRLIGFNFAPEGWFLCDGSLKPISQYEALYALIGTTYGGDGVSTFAVPDLRGRVTVHQAGAYGMGQKGGQETVTLNAAQTPAHSHQLMAVAANGTANLLQAAVLAGGNVQVYVQTSPSPTTKMNPNTVTPFVGGNQPHNNIQPYQAINWIIAWAGLFPPRG
jgi:microcystin-dependent protein